VKAFYANGGGVAYIVNLQPHEEANAGPFRVWARMETATSVTFTKLTADADWARALPALRKHIIGTRSGHYIALLLNKAETVMPPEIHQVLDPYINKLEDRLDPKEPFEPNAPLPFTEENTTREASWPSSAPRSQ
jgi:hypothetical protein